MIKNKVDAIDLSKELVDALHEKEKESYVLIEATETESPNKIVERIKEYVDKLLVNEDLSEEELREYALKLGTLWGEMVIKEYNWKWQYLDFGDGAEGLYIVSPKNYYCCPPLFFLTKILIKTNVGFDGNNDNTVALLFNMIEEIKDKEPKMTYQIVI